MEKWAWFMKNDMWLKRWSDESIKRSLSFHLFSTKILKPRTKLFFVNVLDGNECCKKIKLFPKVEHGQILLGSLFDYNENMKGL